MRSPVRIRVAAPENPATVAVAGFFVYQRQRKNHDAGQGSPVRRRFAYVRFQPPKPMHGVRPPPFGGGLRFPCRGKSICESLPKPSVSDAFDRLSERACKPGSVIDSHLSRRTVAGAFQPPPWDGRAGHSPSAVLLRIEFTAPHCLQPASELLPHFSTLTRSLGRFVSVALVRGSPLAGVTRYPCPVEPGLSSRTAFRLVPAAVRLTRPTILHILPHRVKSGSDLFSCNRHE